MISEMRLLAKKKATAALLEHLVNASTKYPEHLLDFLVGGQTHCTLESLC